MNKVEAVLIHHGTKEIGKFRIFLEQIKVYLKKGPVLVVYVCPGTYDMEVEMLHQYKCLPRGSKMLSVPLEGNKEECPKLLAVLTNSTKKSDFAVVIVICKKELSGHFPSHLLIHSLKVEGSERRISGIVEEGETVVVDTMSKTRHVIKMPIDTVRKSSGRVAVYA